jgi:hypothetical protein
MVLRTGFGGVHALGRWDYVGVGLISEACDTGVWDLVVEYAAFIEWDDRHSN